MTAKAVTNYFPFFYDIDGKPLNGVIYIGEPNTDAQTNPKAVFYDQGLTQNIANPITVKNGYCYQGSVIIRPFVSGDYSMTVVSNKGQVVFNSLTDAGLNYDTLYSPSPKYPWYQRVKRDYAASAWKQLPGTPGEARYPYGLVSDAQGNVYVGLLSPDIAKVSPTDGSVVEYISTGGLIFRDRDMVADWSSNLIYGIPSLAYPWNIPPSLYRFNPTTKVFASVGALYQTYYNPNVGMAISSKGSIYITASGNPAQTATGTYLECYTPQSGQWSRVNLTTETNLRAILAPLVSNGLSDDGYFSCYTMAGLPNERILFAYPQYRQLSDGVIKDTNIVLIYNIPSKTFANVSGAPNLIAGRDQGKRADCTQLPDGRVHIYGLYPSGDLLFDPETNTFSSIPQSPSSNSYLSRTALPDGSIISSSDDLHFYKL